METESFDYEALSLLYVEDDEESRRFLRAALEHKYPDLRVDVAGNGAEGLAMFQEHRHEIVITDINMPVLDGIRMSSEIRLLEPKTNIIVLTGNSDARNMQKSAALGIENYLLKPLKFLELIKVLNGMMIPKQIVGIPA